MLKKTSILVYLGINLFTTSFVSGASFINFSNAKVQLLNKLTGKYSVVSLKINSVYNFDDKMFIVLRKCSQSSKQDDPENIAFFQISRVVLNNNNEKQPINNLNNQIEIPKDLITAYANSVFNKSNNYTNVLIYSGFMYSSSPSLNIVQDPIYDVTLISCI